jgi:hypothetical protein
MGHRRLWTAYVGSCMLALGVALLVLPPGNAAIRYSAADAVWVRVDGMLAVSLAYFNFALMHERHHVFLRVNVICHAAAAAMISIMAMIGRSALVGGMAALVWVGVAGSALSLRHEVAPDNAAASLRLPLTARWNLYVASYTFAYAIATGLVPHFFLPLLGFPDPEDLWVRLAGVLFFSLCVINVIAFLEKGTRRVILAIVTFRIWIVANLLVFGLLGYPWFVYASAGIVGVGVIGTIISYRREPADGAAPPLSAPVR